MRISDWSSDVCSSDLLVFPRRREPRVASLFAANSGLPLSREHCAHVRHRFVDMIEGTSAARTALDAGRPALIWQRTVEDRQTPVAAALKLIEPWRGDFLLESVEGGAVRGRYSLLGLAPEIGRAHV